MNIVAWYRNARLSEGVTAQQSYFNSYLECRLVSLTTFLVFVYGVNLFFVRYGVIFVLFRRRISTLSRRLGEGANWLSACLVTADGGDAIGGEDKGTAEVKGFYFHETECSFGASASSAPHQSCMHH